MSIFPKKTIPGSTVTIHWNFNTAHLHDQHIFPFVRIGVIRPDGECTLLIEKNILALPDTAPIPVAGEPPPARYLRKSTPLLVMADYLSGTHKKEAFVDILQNLASGRHFYCTYTILPDAPLGKYTLLSEVHSDGRIRYSKTAAEDFFYVEKVSVRDTHWNDRGGTTTLINHSPEAVMVKIVEYTKAAPAVSIVKLSSFEVKEISFSCLQTFVIYNEERVIIPLYVQDDLLVLRNQRWLSLNKSGTDGTAMTYLLNNAADEAFQLNDQQQYIWNKADGLITRSMLRTPDLAELYDDMLLQGLITEIQTP